METIRLGLVGDNIAASRAPDLHRAAARICGIDLTYERLVPRDLGLAFDAVIERAKEQGLRGLNITHPYKERILPFVTIEDSTVRAIGACNTVLFGTQTIGLNTDYTGYIAAFKERFGDTLPGMVAMAGNGGAGKAIGFALAQLGAQSLSLFDIDERKSLALADALGNQQCRMDVRVARSIQDASKNADGLINCTPRGMTGYGGNAFEGIRLNGRRWICEAVYTPIETPFLKEGRTAGVDVLSGYELFLYQGIHAFQLFTGRQVDSSTLRQMLSMART
ncbi:MAG TPA: shikimate dehydrogenase [Pseudolabrys sp.]|nr:shikimate dehydrogenase [Pseudolabrys sp.]